MPEIIILETRFSEEKLMEIMRQFDKITATFNPQKTDDLIGMENCIGKRFEFEALWVITRGPYMGQWAMAPSIDFPIGWVPLCDLDKIESEN